MSTLSDVYKYENIIYLGPGNINSFVKVFVYTAKNALNDTAPTKNTTLE